MYLSTLIRLGINKETVLGRPRKGFSGRITWKEKIFHQRGQYLLVTARTYWGHRESLALCLPTFTPSWCLYVCFYCYCCHPPVTLELSVFSSLLWAQDQWFLRNPLGVQCPRDCRDIQSCTLEQLQCSQPNHCAETPVLSYPAHITHGDLIKYTHSGHLSNSYQYRKKW